MSAERTDYVLITTNDARWPGIPTYHSERTPLGAGYLSRDEADAAAQEIHRWINDHCNGSGTDFSPRERRFFESMADAVRCGCSSARTTELVWDQGRFCCPSCERMYSTDEVAVAYRDQRSGEHGCGTIYYVASDIR